MEQRRWKGVDCWDGKLTRFVAPHQTVKALTAFLTKMEAWVDDIPLQTSPQRFGNKAFRDWIAVMEEVRCYLSPLS